MFSIWLIIFIGVKNTPLNPPLIGGQDPIPPLKACYIVVGNDKNKKNDYTPQNKLQPE